MLNQSKQLRSLFFVLASSIFLLGVFVPAAHAATTYDLADPTNFSIRIDGALAGDNLSRYILVVKDINGNGINDLIVGSSYSDNNSRSNSGSIYIIFDNLLEEYYEGSGHTIDLADASNYNLRIDGPAANSFMGLDDGISVGDIDGDGKADLSVSTAYTDHNSRADSGSLYVMYGSFISGFSTTGNTLDLNVSTSYTIRFDGAVANDVIGDGSLELVDANGDGALDLLFSSHGSDNNSRLGSGSVYVVYNSLLESYSGTGNNIDLLNGSNYNLRYDGAAAEQYLGYAGSIIADYNNDGENDLLLSSGYSTFNSRTNSGSIYIIDNSLYASISGTGNNLDLNTSTNFSARIDGANNGDLLGLLSLNLKDLNNNGINDLIFGSSSADYNTRSTSGSIYLLYDSMLTSISGTGNLFDLSNSTSYTTRFDGAASNQYVGYWPSIGDFSGDGKNDLVIPAVGAGFNSRTNSGSIYILSNDQISTFSGTGNLVDLADEDSFMTRYDGAATSHTLGSGGMIMADINNDGGSDILAVAKNAGFNDRAVSGSLYIIFGTAPIVGPANNNASLNNQSANSVEHAKPRPFLRALDGGLFLEDSSVVIVERGTFLWDANLDVYSELSFTPTLIKSGWWQASPIHEVWFRSVFNNAKLVVPLRPFLLAVRYNPSTLQTTLPEKNLRLAHSLDKVSWTILNNSVLDQVNKTVSVVTKNGGYYMLVSGYPR